MIGDSLLTPTTDSIIPPDRLTSHLLERLSQVTPSLIPQAKLNDFRIMGGRALSAAPERLMSQSLELARVNPVLCVAWGIGAVEYARLSQDPWIASVATVALGIALVEWGQYRKACAALRPAMAWLEAGLRQDKSLLFAHWHLILAENALRHSPTAGQQLLGLADRLIDNGQEYAAMCCRVDSLSDAVTGGDASSLRQYAHEAIDYFTRHEHGAELGRARLSDGLRCLRVIGQLEQGLADFETAEAHFADSQAYVGMAQVWLGKARICQSRRDFEQAAKWIDYALTRSRQIQHDQLVCLSLIAQSELGLAQGNFAERLEGLSEVVSRAAGLGMGTFVSRARLLAGRVSYHQRRYVQAQRSFERAQTGFERYHDSERVIACQIRLGMLMRRQGQFTEALAMLRQANQAADSCQAFDTQIDASFELGVTYASLGYYEPAIEFFNRCIALLEESGLVARLAGPLINLAYINAACGELRLAQQQLARAAEIVETGVDSAAIQQLQGDLAYRSGESSNARNWYRLSIEQLRKLAQVTAAQKVLLRIGSAYVAMNHPEQGEKALEALAADDLPASLRSNYFTLKARLAQSRQAPHQALDDFVNALRETRQIRHTLLSEDLIARFAQDNRRAYADALKLAIDLQAFHKALEIIELVRAHSQSVEDVFPFDFDQAKALLNAKLPMGWTILRYAWLEQGHDKTLLIFVVASTHVDCHSLKLTPDQMIMLKLHADEHDLIRQKAYLPTQNNTGNHSADLSSRRLLGELLIPQAARDRLRPAQPLIIIPAGELNGLPFGAVFDGDKPLIDRAQLSYAPSLSALIELLEASQPNAPQGGLALAQSRFAIQGYPELPSVRKEIKSILSKTQGSALALGEDELSRARLMEMNHTGELARHAWLHIATHAYVDPDTREFVGLIFGEDVVTIADIQSWKLFGALVTVAACQTALGHWGYADDLAGIAQAFLKAGAKSVIASLWSIDDEESRRIVTAFYGEFFKGLSPAAALARVQRKAHKKGIAPYHWAAFGLYGHP